VVAHHKARHGLEHGYVDALATPGAVAIDEARADRAYRRQPDDTINERIGHIARHAI
jgi:hypothetical protein